MIIFSEIFMVNFRCYLVYIPRYKYSFVLVTGAQLRTRTCSLLEVPQTEGQLLRQPLMSLSVLLSLNLSLY